MGGALASGVAFFDTFVASASLRGLGASDGNGSRPPVFTNDLPVGVGSGQLRYLQSFFHVPLFSLDLGTVASFGLQCAPQAQRGHTHSYSPTSVHGWA